MVDEKRSLVAEPSENETYETHETDGTEQPEPGEPATEAGPLVDGAATVVSKQFDRRNPGKDFRAELSKDLRERGDLGVFVLNSEQRIAEKMNDGYRMATPAEVDTHTGIVRGKKVVQGDTVLMIKPSEVTEGQARSKADDRARMEGDYKEHDAKAGITREEGHGQRRGNKRYFLP